MLQKMRSGAQSILIKVVLFGLLMLAMLGLAFTDVQGMFRGGIASTGAVAKVDGKKITAPEFDMIYQRAMREQNMTSEEALRNALPLVVLNQEINARVYSRAAYDLGLIVDDRTAATELKRDILTPIAQGAGIDEKEALKRVLANLGVSERAFVDTFKSQMATDTLLSTLQGTARAPQQLVNDALKRRYEWRRGEYFELTAADLGKDLQPASEDELKKYYTSIASDFLLPEYRSFDVLLISRAALGLDGKPDAAAIEQYYEEHKGDYEIGEQRKIEQIIAADEATATALAAEAKGGKTLADVAKTAKASGDASKAKTVFAASTYSEGDMDVELASAAFDAKANDLVGPIQTPLGWHVMKIVSISPARTRPLAEVRADIEKDMADEINSDALYARAEEMDELIAGGATLDEVATQYKLKVQSFADITSEGNDKTGKAVDTKLPAFAKIVETAYTLDEGRTSQLTETSEGDLLLISTTSVTKAQEQPFDVVRDEVADSLRLKKMGELFDAKSAAITEKIQLGESFDSIAASLGKRVSSTGLIQRDTAPAKAGIARGVLPALFSLDKIGHTTSVSGEEKVTILRLAERKVDAPKEAKKEDLTALQGTLDRALKNDILEQYRAHLLEKYKVSINEELVMRMYTRRAEDENL